MENIDFGSECISALWAYGEVDFIYVSECGKQSRRSRDRVCQSSADHPLVIVLIAPFINCKPHFLAYFSKAASPASASKCNHAAVPFRNGGLLDVGRRCKAFSVLSWRYVHTFVEFCKDVPGIDSVPPQRLKFLDNSSCFWFSLAIYDFTSIIIHSTFSRLSLALFPVWKFLTAQILARHRKADQAVFPHWNLSMIPHIRITTKVQTTMEARGAYMAALLRTRHRTWSMLQ